MKNRVLFSSLAAVAGLAVSANAQVNTTSSSSVTMTVHYLGDTGDNDGLLEPGEKGILSFDISYTGRNTVGSWSQAFQGQTTGTLRGLGGGFVDLVGTGGTAGTWSNDPNDPGGNGTLLQNGAFAIADGTPGANGVTNIQFGQLPTTAGGINTTGPFTPMWQALWTPASYADRFVSFNGQAAVAAGANPFSVLFKTIFLPDPPAPDRQLVISAFTLQNSFVGSGGIHVVPTPSSLALLGLGGLIAGRRRRR